MVKKGTAKSEDLLAALYMQDDEVKEDILENYYNDLMT